MIPRKSNTCAAFQRVTTKSPDRSLFDLGLTDNRRDYNPTGARQSFADGLCFLAFYLCVLRDPGGWHSSYSLTIVVCIFRGQGSNAMVRVPREESRLRCFPGNDNGSAAAVT